MKAGLQGLEPRGRILTLMAFVLSAYLVLLGRLAYWQVSQSAPLQQKLNAQVKYDPADHPNKIYGNR